MSKQKRKNLTRIIIIVGIGLTLLLILFNKYYLFNDHCTKTQCEYSYNEQQREELESMLFKTNLVGSVGDSYQGNYLDEGYCNMVLFEDGTATIFQTYTCFIDPVTKSPDDDGLDKCRRIDRFENSCFNGKDGITKKTIERNNEFSKINSMLE